MALLASARMSSMYDSQLSKWAKHDASYKYACLPYECFKNFIMKTKINTLVNRSKQFLPVELSNQKHY